ncbi:ENV2 protein, partial [Picathartes gymnocephalus]|nr:ENV2 protein [Picathartes gymnocephalus]
LDPLWKMIRASYSFLNSTHSELTRHCWLCYDVRPPYYEAIGMQGSLNKSNESSPPQCNWKDRRKRITMQYVTGVGTCLG